MYLSHNPDFEHFKRFQTEMEQKLDRSARQTSGRKKSGMTPAARLATTQLRTAIAAVFNAQLMPRFRDHGAELKTKT